MYLDIQTNRQMNRQIDRQIENMYMKKTSSKIDGCKIIERQITRQINIQIDN